MKYLGVIGYFICCLSVFGQNIQDNLNSSSRSLIQVRGASDIKGSKFIYGDWNSGIFVLNDEIKFMREYVSVDAYETKLFVKENEQAITVYEITDSNLTGFSIRDKKTNLNHQFIVLKDSDFLVGKISGFFEILDTNNKTPYFLKNIQVILFDPNKSKGTAAINNFPKEYKEEFTYFLKNEKGLYVEVRLKKKDILAVLNGHPTEMMNYIKSKKIKLSRESDMVKLISYYYSLN